MAGEAATELELELSEGQIDLVVHDEQAWRSQMKLAQRWSDTATGQVHVRERFEQRHLPVGFGHIRDAEHAVVLGDPRRASRHGERFDDCETDVVWRVLVLASRVAQAGDEPAHIVLRLVLLCTSECHEYVTFPGYSDAARRT